ncbi:GfV-B64-ORF1 [Ichnoviriform fumiferanae]|uniref:GfV-B64-ORF1 n=1 Tax=Ichnoviriform fumiferanae TaxID=419435 RepID=A2PZV9_9VIRU|nr:GfV-B64-ORF1 [Ichnoviriform fumiferanae]BAF45531.1 GfV-B64-ORF1 [Ichnoviriform fumiferanae]
MTRQPSVSKRIKMYKLVDNIDKCNDLLKGKEIRYMLNRAERAQMVKIQICKAALINKLKMLVRDIDNIPSDILERIYPF